MDNAQGMQVKRACEEFTACGNDDQKHYLQIRDGKDRCVEFLTCFDTHGYCISNNSSWPSHVKARTLKKRSTLLTLVAVEIPRTSQRVVPLQQDAAKLADRENEDHGESEACMR